MFDNQYTPHGNNTFFNQMFDNQCTLYGNNTFFITVLLTNILCNCKNHAIPRSSFQPNRSTLYATLGGGHIYNHFHEFLMLWHISSVHFYKGIDTWQFLPFWAGRSLINKFVSWILLFFIYIFLVLFIFIYHAHMSWFICIFIYMTRTF